MRKPLFAAVVVSTFATPAFAQTTSDLALKPWGENQLGETDDKILYQEQGHLRGGEGGDDDHVQVFWWDSKGRFRFDKTDAEAPTLGYRYVTMDFGSGRTPGIPDTLDEVSLAAGLHLGDVGDWKASAVGGAGYSGDNLFASEDGLFGIAHVLFERPLDDRGNSLVVGAGYDGSSAMFPDAPYPEFALVHRAERHPLTFSLGYPYSRLRYEITPSLSVEADYTVPFSGAVTVEQGVGHGFSVFGNFTNFFNAFYQQDARREERIFYEMRRAELGLRYQNPDVFKGMSLDASLVVGYAFDQQFSTGWDVRDRDPSAELSDEPYIGIVLRGTF